MSAGLDTQTLGIAFKARPDILEGIRRAADSPSRISLFNEIAAFVCDQLPSGPEPAQKRRRVDIGGTNGFTSSNANGSGADTKHTASSAAEEPVLLEIKEISVSVPQRKKFDICFTKNFLYARAPGTTGPVQGISYAWQDIEYAFYLPVPEKTQVQHNYILFPRGTSLPNKTAPPAVEPLVLTVPATPPKQGTIAGPSAAAASDVSDSYESLFNWALTRLPGHGLKIVAADPTRFHSLLRQPHRPAEKAVHIKAFRGSKDGYLFFLENGILWGFKKPLIFLPLERIAAVSYTSVLQRTFNIVVEVFTGEDASDEASEELEFAMIDQEDYAGIDEKYVKRNGLQDRSMAEQRKAKLQLAENKARKGEAGEGGEGAANGAASGDGLTELERAHVEAEQQLQDDEDEDEEDYDPGSGGDSEGSGESSEEDDDDDDDEAEGEEGDEEENGEGMEYDEEEE